MRLYCVRPMRANVASKRKYRKMTGAGRIIDHPCPNPAPSKLVQKCAAEGFTPIRTYGHKPSRYLPRGSPAFWSNGGNYDYRPLAIGGFVGIPPTALHKSRRGMGRPSVHGKGRIAASMSTPEGAPLTSASIAKVGSLNFSLIFYEAAP